MHVLRVADVWSRTGSKQGLRHSNALSLPGQTKDIRSRCEKGKCAKLSHVFRLYVQLYGRSTNCTALSVWFGRVGA